MIFDGIANPGAVGAIMPAQPMPGNFREHVGIGRVVEEPVIAFASRQEEGDQEEEDEGVAGGPAAPGRGSFRPGVLPLEETKQQYSGNQRASGKTD